MAYTDKDVTLGKAMGAWLLIVGVPGAILIGVGYATEALFGWDPEIVALAALPLIALGFLVFLTVDSISQEVGSWRLRRRMRREQVPPPIDDHRTLWPSEPIGRDPSRSPSQDRRPSS